MSRTRGRPVARVAHRIGSAADWAQRARPRWPVIPAAGHPEWVERAVNEALPAVALLAVLGILGLLDRGWAWLLTGIAAGGFALVFHVLPWTVSVARSFVAGYRGD